MVFIGRVGEINDKTGDRYFNAPVYWDMVDTQHLFLCGISGSGKSYTMAVFIEGFLESESGAGAVVIEPHGEHYSFKMPSENPELLAKNGICFPGNMEMFRSLLPQQNLPILTLLSMESLIFV